MYTFLPRHCSYLNSGFALKCSQISSLKKGLDFTAPEVR